MLREEAFYRVLVIGVEPDLPNPAATEVVDPDFAPVHRPAAARRRLGHEGDDVLANGEHVM